jgi:saccharopine dehydrogenase (NAD+, L-lysine-forming)
MRRRIVILGGAGAMGRITARDLARTGGARVEVVIADRERPADRIPGVKSVPLDVTDRASLERALAGAWATIASLPYRFNLLAMEGALAAGAHYLDLGGLFHMTRRQLARAGDFERRGLMAILGIGSAPGILNVLAARAARDLESVTEVHCLVGARDRTRYIEAPPLGFGYSVDTLLDEFVLPSAVFRDGRFAMVPALDPGERVSVRFPAPVGRLDVDTTLHSEVATLPLHFKARGIREVTFRQGFDPTFAERLGFLVRLGLADDGAPPPRNGTRSKARPAPDRAAPSPRDVLLRLIDRLPKPVLRGKPERHEVLRIVVRGRRRGRAVVVTGDCVVGPRAGGGVGPDIDTGAPPSIAVQLMLAGEIALRPGVWAPEQVIPTEPFVRELERRGMRVSQRVAGRSRRGQVAR